MTADLATIAPKLGRLVRMLGSEADGEALGAARAIDRVLKGAGATLHDLADMIEKPTGPALQVFRWPSQSEPRRPEPERQPRWAFLDTLHRHCWINVALSCGPGADNAILDQWQTEFVSNARDIMRTRNGKPLTDKQISVLDSILARLWAKGVRLQ